MKDYTLIYLRHERLWLMMLRNKKMKDINAGKWIGVGVKADCCAVRVAAFDVALRSKRRYSHLLHNCRFGSCRGYNYYVCY